MKDVKQAVAMVLRDLSRLSVPAVAASVAAIIVPILVAVAGLKVTAVEVAGWLVLAGSAAATLQKLTAVKATKVP